MESRSVKRLEELREKIKERPKEKLERVRKMGKLTARERIEKLLDPGSFMEFYEFTGLKKDAPSEGIICGMGTIDGRPVSIYSQDPTILGGSIGYVHGRKMYKTVERALELGIPVIGLHDSPGARVARPEEPEENIMFISDEKTGNSIFYINTLASGVIPQIAVILGTCAGISVYSPALMDFIVMVDGTSHMFITGPRIIKSVTGEEISFEELGGAKIHSRISGVCDFRARGEEESFLLVRKLLSYLPQNAREKPPRKETTDPLSRPNDDLADIVPEDPHKSYDVRKVIRSILDEGEFLEVKEEFAPEIVIGFGRLGGRVVGIVANQPMVRAGCLTYNSSCKQARFIRFCDCFNIPIILLVDTPAYLPGKEQEHGGIIRHGSKVLFALCEATVPKIALIMRKAYGGGNLGMGVMPGFGTDFVLSWPFAECGVLGAEQSVELFYAREIAEAENPEELRRRKVEEYRELYTDPVAIASASTRMEMIITPRETRRVLGEILKFMDEKKSFVRVEKKHSNIPL